MQVCEHTGVLDNFDTNRGHWCHPDGCDLFIGDLMLPANRQFESWAEWSRPEVIVPQTPDLLLPREVEYVSQHRELLEDLRDNWEAPEKEPIFDTAPMTMPELKRQVEDWIQGKRWTLVGTIGLVVTAAIAISLCLWRHWQAVLAVCAWIRRTVAKGGKKKSTHGEVELERGHRNEDTGTQSTTTVFQ
jgi:hypothetical protein